MAALAFCAFAERITVDGFSNSLDLHNMIEQVSMPQLPTEVFARSRKEGKPIGLPVRLMFVALWRRTDAMKSEGTFKGRIVLSGPSKKVLSTLFQDISLREHTSVRGVINYQVLPFDGAGVYKATVSLRSGSSWRKVGEASFVLSYQTAPIVKPPALIVKPTNPNRRLN
jgi:hypothetical protein